jgi:hypothetical protein
LPSGITATSQPTRLKPSALADAALAAFAIRQQQFHFLHDAPFDE